MPIEYDLQTIKSDRKYHLKSGNQGIVRETRWIVKKGNKFMQAFGGQQLFGCGGSQGL